jgi:hypothetical protein
MLNNSGHLWQIKTMLERLSSGTQNNNKCCEDVGKKEPSYTTVGNVNYYNH